MSASSVQETWGTGKILAHFNSVVHLLNANIKAILEEIKLTGEQISPQKKELAQMNIHFNNKNSNTDRNDDRDKKSFLEKIGEIIIKTGGGNNNPKPPKNK